MWWWRSPYHATECECWVIQSMGTIDARDSITCGKDEWRATSLTVIVGIRHLGSLGVYDGNDDGSNASWNSIEIAMDGGSSVLVGDTNMFHASTFKFHATNICHSAATSTSWIFRSTSISTNEDDIHTNWTFDSISTRAFVVWWRCIYPPIQRFAMHSHIFNIVEKC